MSKARELAEKAYPEGDTYIFGDASIACQVAYVKGYRQAEKDLDVVSWVKEVSGVKEISRAKEEALKAYPPQSIAANYDTIDRRDAFEYGYLKAEKDLELTCEDIQKIDVLIYAVLDEEKYKRYYTQDRDGNFYEEVLKRFNKIRNERLV